MTIKRIQGAVAKPRELLTIYKYIQKGPEENRDMKLKEQWPTSGKRKSIIGRKEILHINIAVKKEKKYIKHKAFIT